MAKPVVYVETSVISYLAAPPSRDLIVAERQRLTREWWDRREEYQFVTSEIVMAELRRGKKSLARKRLRAAEGLHQMPFDVDSANELADRLVHGGSLPAVARFDALHVAVATLNEAQFVATWNLKHLANPTIRTRAEKVIRSMGLEPAIIRTPQELLGLMS